MLDADEQRLVAGFQNGFPLVERPFEAIGQAIGLDETEVLNGLRMLQEKEIIKRIGVVVHHHELGYRANAMVVWDVPDERTREVGERIRDSGMVSLCYLRRRCPPHWPYNLYCMIHGRDREETMLRAELITRGCDMQPYAREILFSRRRFKQCGARYF
ncbi:MAG: hypothetical protein H7834_04415 [Magnetococcus sp. YQC-9]